MKAVFAIIGAFAGGFGGGRAHISTPGGPGFHGTSLGGFASGGYTGDGGANQVAGLVHGREFVFNADATRYWGRDNLERMASGQAPVTNNNGGNTIHVHNHFHGNASRQTVEQAQRMMIAGVHKAMLRAA